MKNGNGGATVGTVIEDLRSREAQLESELSQVRAAIEALVSLGAERSAVAGKQAPPKRRKYERHGRVTGAAEKIMDLAATHGPITCGEVAGTVYKGRSNRHGRANSILSYLVDTGRMERKVGDAGFYLYSVAAGA